MKILVCIKEVPDLNPEVEVNPSISGSWVDFGDSAKYMINRFDEFAIEEALLIKEQFSEAIVDVITIGEKRSEAILRRALGMGCGHGIHIQTNITEYLSPLLIAKGISSYVKEKSYNLILTGVMSEDLQQGQTGVMVAQRLNIPWASAVINQEISSDGSKIKAEREIEGGNRDIRVMPLPCLLTIQSGINQPRYPALSKVLKAKKAILEECQLSDLIDLEEYQKIVHVDHPKKTRKGQVIEGSSAEKARKLFEIINQKSLFKES